MSTDETIVYYPGDVAVLTATFADADGNPADPTDVTFKVRDPLGDALPADQTITTITPSKVAVGVYTVDVQVDSSGLWQWVATGTGNVEAAGPDSFTVLPLPF